MTPATETEPDPITLPALGRGGSVLYVGNWWVEWFGVDGRGRVVHVRREVEGEHPSDFVRAAVEAIRTGGLGKRACTVALAEVHATEKRIDVPPLKRVEIRQILQRKAAALLKTDLDATLFAARPARSAKDDEGPQESEKLTPWIVLAMRREFVRDLLVRLRRSGVRTKRVVSARFARVSSLTERYGVEDDGETAVGTVIVDVETHSVSVHLMHGGNSITDSALSGSFEESAGLGISLLQELRGLEAHWRKLSRGGRLGRVVFVGLSAGSANRLAVSLETALPGVEIVFYPGGDADLVTARKYSLSACAERGPFDIELNVQLPRRPLAVAFVLSVVGFLAGSAGIVAHEEMSTRLSDLEGRELTLRQATEPLGELEARSGELRSGLTRLHTEIDRAIEIERIGIPLEALMTQTLEALGSDAQLHALSATRRRDGHAVVITGRTHGHPILGLQALTRIQRDLSAAALFEGVELRPPTLLVLDKAEEDQMPFELLTSMSGFLPQPPEPSPNSLGGTPYDSQGGNP